MMNAVLKPFLSFLSILIYKSIISKGFDANILSVDLVFLLQGGKEGGNIAWFTLLTLCLYICYYIRPETSSFIFYF